MKKGGLKCNAINDTKCNESFKHEKCSLGRYVSKLKCLFYRPKSKSYYLKCTFLVEHK